LTASYSRIIIDEIQSFSPDSIAAIMVFLKEIHNLGGKFLLTTATLPPFIKEELRELKDIEFPVPVIMETRRHKIAVYKENIDDELSLKMIEDNFRSGKRILVVCNTVRKAQDMYEFLKHLNSSLIHSRFILKDRKRKESEEEGIMAINKDNHPPIIWIATQVVEASLDLDFDVLFTECSPIDSILQRFGRCWRNRKQEYTNKEPNIHIFKSKHMGIYDKEILDRTYCLLFNEFNGKTISELEKQDAINAIFKDIQATKYYEKYKRNKQLLEFGFKASSISKAEYLFRNILFNYCVIPWPVYKKNEKDIIDLLKHIDDEYTDKKENIRVKNELKQFALPVQISSHFSCLSPVADSRYCKRNNIMLMNDVAYSYEKGLEITDKNGEGILIE